MWQKMAREGHSRVGEGLLEMTLEKDSTVSWFGTTAFQAGWREERVWFIWWRQEWLQQHETGERGRGQMMAVLAIHAKMFGSYYKLKGKPLEGFLLDITIKGWSLKRASFSLVHHCYWSLGNFQERFFSLLLFQSFSPNKDSAPSLYEVLC